MPKPIPDCDFERCHHYGTTEWDCLCENFRPSRYHGCKTAGSYVCPDQGDRICKHMHKVRQAAKLESAAAKARRQAQLTEDVMKAFGWDDSPAQMPEPVVADAPALALPSFLETTPAAARAPQPLRPEPADLQELLPRTSAPRPGRVLRQIVAMGITRIAG